LNEVDSRQNLLRELWNRHCLSPEQDISDTLAKTLSAMTKK
jgi:hypothetical protein